MTKAFARTDRTIGQRTPMALYPDQVAHAYDLLPDIDASARHIVICELGGMFNVADIFAYCAARGYKMPKLSVILVDGATQTSSAADGEVALDICVVAGIAQGARITVIFGPNTEQGMIDIQAAAVALNPDSISWSWGAPEDQWSAEGREAFDALFRKAELNGIATYAASGDSGSSDGELGNHVDYPASSPFAIACGGTHLEIDGNGNRATESAWSTGLFNPSGSGGGVSSIYLSATRQEAMSGQKYRTVPDVAGNADPATGWIVRIDGEDQTVGGTSAVAPMYAAYQAKLNAKAKAHVGFMPGRIYNPANAAGFYDVTQGGNGGYSAKTGYDMVTGMGVINGGQFALLTLGK